MVGSIHVCVEWKIALPRAIIGCISIGGNNPILKGKESDFILYNLTNFNKKKKSPIKY